MSEAQRRLYRSQTNKVIAGVCGGIGEYLNIDPTLIRIGVLVLTIFGGSGILLYIVAFFVMPEGPVARTVSHDGSPSSAGTASHGNSPSTAAMVLGGFLILIGGMILMDNLDIISFHQLRHLSWDFLFPALLILAGVFALTRKRNVPPAAQPAGPSSAPEAPPAEQSVPPGPKTLKRSVRDRKLFGICGGLGEYFEVDPTIIRILYIVFTFLSGGAGVVIYFILFFVVPEERTAASA
jgi:phage shock protein C